jgi:hypothetical protein
MCSGRGWERLIVGLGDGMGMEEGIGLGVEKPDLDSASSVVIMEYLTKRCLDFELKFGKYPGRYG